MDGFIPAYLRAFDSGRLEGKIEQAEAILRDCRLCPRECRVNRMDGQTGICRTGRQARVADYCSHRGEESCISGSRGSGTIFFSRCSLLCLFCQNYEISHEGEGQEVTAGLLAGMMLDLQNRGCHNINFVTPTHVVPQILSALGKAVEGGLRIPLVYNSGGYDSVETLKLLDGIVDIYMPDFKFLNPDFAEETCGTPDYPDAAKTALREMFRQVGDLVLGGDGIARRGLLVRHLVMPGQLEDTRKILRYIHDEISPETYVNLMSQYHPAGRAYQIRALSGPLSRSEFRQALDIAAEEGIRRLDRLF